MLKIGYEFFQETIVKKLRKMDNGDTYICIYLKMVFLASENEGILEYSKIEESFEKEIATKIDEPQEFVKNVINFLQEHKIMEHYKDLDAYSVGLINLKLISESSAERMRKHRSKKALTKKLQTQKSHKSDSRVTASDNEVTACDSQVTACDGDVTVGDNLKIANKKQSIPQVPVEIIYAKAPKDKK